MNIFQYFIIRLYEPSLRRMLCTLCITFLGLFVQNTHGQISKTHYLPPIFGLLGQSEPVNTLFYEITVTTLESQPFQVVIENEDGSYTESAQVSFGNPVSFVPRNNGTTYGLLIQNRDSQADEQSLSGILNTQFLQHGLTVTGKKPFFVNVLHRTANHGEVITSKGSAAPGKEFYSGHMHSTFSNPGDNHAKVKSHFISFMATQEGTTTVTVTNNTLRFYGQTENTFKVTLNKGESYIVGNSLRSIENECGLDDNCINGYNGTHITSTKEIVVNSGTYLGGYDGTTWRDIGIDQLVPVEKTGMEYILMQGNGSSAAASMEVVIAVATFANTSLTVNGSDTYSLSKPGDYAIIPIDKYINKNMYIQSTKNIYAYQTLAGADKLQTGGLILVPPLNSNSTKEVYISGIGKVGNPLYSFLTQGGAEVRVNGTLLSQSPTTVTGNSDWVTYTITDASIFGGKNADVHITSDKALNASAVFQDDNVGGGGYYSGFSEEESFVGVGTIGIKNYTLACNTPIALLGSGGVAYDWSSKNPTDWDMVEPVPNSGDSAYLFTPKSDMGEGPFAYTVIIDVETEDGIRKDTSDLTIRVIPIDMNFGGDQHVCKGEPTILNYSSRDYSAPVLEQEQVWAVNFGGVAHSGSDDIDYSASENFGYSRGGSVAVISGTNDPELYSNAELYADGDMTLTKKVDNGTYRLSLMFAETYYSNAGERLFNVEVEGTRFKTNLDLIEQVGKNSAYIIEENVIITDGELTIQLLNGTQGSPFINALKLTRDIIETDPHYTWLPASFLNHSNLMSPIATVYDDTEFEVTYDDGHCLIDNSVNVIVEDCGKCRLTAYGNKTICKGESTEISAEGRGDFVDWQYDRKGETKVLTNTTPTVTPDKTTTYLVRYNNAIKTSVTEDFDPAIFCETEVTITVDPCGEIVTPEGEVTKAEIYDVNGDGIAETIHVTFDRPLPQLPRNITSIDWPTEGVNDITADIEELQFLDSTTVMITLDNAFVPATEADVDNPPSLTYGNSSVLIEDKIGPIVIQAEKTTPATLQYAIKDDAGEYTYHLQPDTFKITLSEDIDFPSNGWKEMFSVVAVNGDTYTPAITTKPKSGTAINTLMVIFENTPNTAIPKIGNTLSFNTNNSVTDIYDNQSRQNFVEITGTALTKSSLGINFRNAVVGIDNTTDKNVATEEIPVYNEDNELLEETKYGTAVLSNQWVPPYNYTDGILDPNARCEDIQTEGNFDHRCFASLAIGTFKDQGIYTATIYIYSHLGQYITNWSQSFGECGEFTNSDRNDQTDIEQYFINDLIWNIKGLDGRKVASGVYFWKVVLTFTSGKKEEFTKNMGILRQDNSCE